MTHAVGIVIGVAIAAFGLGVTVGEPFARWVRRQINARRRPPHW